MWVNRPRPRGINGLSLVELLVAMTVGLTLLAGLIHVMSASRATYRLTEAESRAQESGRFAVRSLAKDLRGARSTGCRSLLSAERSHSLNVMACALRNPGNGDGACSGPSAIGSGQRMGYDSGESVGSAWLTELAGNASSGAEKAVRADWLRGDVLIVWGASGAGVNTETGTLNDAQTGTVDLVQPSDAALLGGYEDAHSTLYSKRLALVTDCAGSDIFAVSNGDSSNPPDSIEFGEFADSNIPPPPDDGGPAPAPDESNRINAGSSLSRTYNRVGDSISMGTSIRARIYPFTYSVYFICCTSSGTIQQGNKRDKCNSDPDTYRPALCRWSSADVGANVKQLVADIADLKVTYDGTEDGQRFCDLAPNHEADAAWVAQRRGGQGAWDSVDTVRVELLACNGDQVMEHSVVPPLLNALPGGAVVSADRRIYSRLGTEVAIRAHSLWYVKP